MEKVYLSGFLDCKWFNFDRYGTINYFQDECSFSKDLRVFRKIFLDCLQMVVREERCIVLRRSQSSSHKMTNIGSRPRLCRFADVTGFFFFAPDIIMAEKKSKKKDKMQKMSLNEFQLDWAAELEGSLPTIGT
jgi:hypothetical protein